MTFVLFTIILNSLLATDQDLIFYALKKKKSDIINPVNILKVLLKGEKMKRHFCKITDRFFKRIFKNCDGRTLPYIKGVEVEGETAIIRLKGEINATTIPIIKDNCCNKKKLDKNILLDYEEVTQIDSATLASLVLQLKELGEKHRKLAILNMPDMLQKFLDITNLDGLIATYRDEDEALNFLNSK